MGTGTPAPTSLRLGRQGLSSSPCWVMEVGAPPAASPEARVVSDLTRRPPLPDIRV